MNKVRIYSSHCSFEDYIIWQFNSFKKFIKDDYEFIVINDASNEPNFINGFTYGSRNKIIDVCQELNIKCIEFNEELHHNRTILFPNTNDFNINPCTRCANVTQYAIQDAKNYNGIVVILDNDIFLTSEFNFNEYMKNYNIAFLPQSRPRVGEYPWNALLILKPTELPSYEEINMDCGVINNSPVDVGGYCSIYLDKYRDSLKIRRISGGRFFDVSKDITVNTINELNCSEHIKEILRNMVPEFGMLATIKIFIEFYENCFYHFRSGGNWDTIDNNKLNKRIQILYYYFNKYIK